MSDPEQPGEGFDEELLEEEYPPEQPMAVDDQGITGAEQLGGESVADREERTEPEVWQRRQDARRAGRSTVTEEAAQPSDEDIEVMIPVEEETRTDPLAPDDEATGDETTRGYATEGQPEPAEEAAVHDQEEDGERPLD